HPDVDLAEVVATQATLVGESADDLAGLDLVALAHRDAVGRQVGVRTGTTRSALLVATSAVVAAAAPVVATTAVVAVVARGVQEFLLRLQGEGVLAVHHRGDGGGDVDLGHVVLVDVVLDHVAEEVDLLRVGQGGCDALVEGGQALLVDVVDAR